MSAVMEDEIKRWTTRRKSALVLEIIQGKTTVADASRAFDIMPSEIEARVEVASVVWRTRCGPSSRTCASSTSAS
jgi:transposase-like protein